MYDQNGGLHLQLEETGKAAEVFEGLWIIATKHRPGFSSHMFEINNRCFVFRLDDLKIGKPVLVVVNAVDPAQAIGHVRHIERRTQLPVHYIVSPGGVHHLMMAAWHREFTEAELLLPPVRIPHTRNGQKLLKLPRVSIMDADDPLPQFKGELDAVIFRGLLGPSDVPTPSEGSKDNWWNTIKHMLQMMPSREPVDELWLHHVASGTVIGGENLGWFYPLEVLHTQPLVLRSLIKPEKVQVMTSSRKVGDPTLVEKSWQRVLEWPARALLTYHDVPSNGFVGDARSALWEAAKEAKQWPPAA